MKFRYHSTIVVLRQKTNMSRNNKFTLFLINFTIVTLLIVPLALNYIFSWSEPYYVGIYSFYIFGYLFTQMLLSSLNNTKKKYLDKDGEDDFNHLQKNINLSAVGYREDPAYFKLCLESFKECIKITPNFNRLIVVIDGQDAEDAYMVEIFQEVFADNNPIHLDLDRLPSKENIQYAENVTSQMTSKYVCITQPHAGKRHGMYTAMKLTVLENEMLFSSVKGFFCTDSDTKIDQDVANELYKCLRFKNVGAACGTLTILNKYDTVLSFLINLRYWFSFFVERGYQSYNKYVLCVSGPMGMYNVNTIKDVLDDWVNQTFLGQECTYGDDRHLTNKILEQGKHVVYSPVALGYTETPSTFLRFYKQQIRWAKSSYREFLINCKYIDRQSRFMTLDLLYQSMYSLIVVFLLFYALLFGSFFTLGLYFIFLVGIGILKGLYGAIWTRNPEFLLYGSYGYLFLFLLLPARLYGMLSLKDISWGTSGRKVVRNTWGMDVAFLALWFLIIAAVFAFNIYNNLRLNDTGYWWIIGAHLGGISTFVFVGLYINIRKCLVRV